MSQQDWMSAVTLIELGFDLEIQLTQKEEVIDTFCRLNKRIEPNPNSKVAPQIIQVADQLKKKEHNIDCFNRKSWLS